jgi:hypothetical protein
MKVVLGDRYSALIVGMALALALLSRAAELGLDVSGLDDAHALRAEGVRGDAVWPGYAIAVGVLLFVYPRVVRRDVWLVPAFLVTTLVSPIAAATMGPASAAIAIACSESLQTANWMLVLLVASRSTKYLGAVVMPPVAARLATMLVGLGVIGLSLDRQPLPVLVVGGLAAATAAVLAGRAFGARVRSASG